MTEKLLELLNLPAGSGEEDIISTITSFQGTLNCMADLGGLLGVAATAPEIKNAVRELQEASCAAVPLQWELDQLKRDRAAGKAKEAVDRALKSGRINPDAREQAQKIAETDLEGFEALMFGVSQMRPREANPDGQDEPAADIAGLTSEELLIAKALWITPEQFKASKEAIERSETKGYVYNLNLASGEARREVA